MNDQETVAIRPAKRRKASKHARGRKVERTTAGPVTRIPADTRAAKQSMAAVRRIIRPVSAVSKSPSHRLHRRLRCARPAETGAVSKWQRWTGPTINHIKGVTYAN